LAVLITGGTIYFSTARRVKVSSSEIPNRENMRTDSSVQEIGAALFASRTSWPNPDSIHTIHEFATTLHRTWLRADSPSPKEIVSRSHYGVSEYQAKYLIADTSSHLHLHHTWTGRDMDAALVALEVFGLPEELIVQWKLAGQRALRRQDLPRLLATIPWIPFLGGLICFAAGVAVVNLSKLHGLGLGNWFAVGISSLVLLIILLFLALISFFEDSWGSRVLSRTGNYLFFLFSVAGFLVGWLHGSHVIVIHHADITLNAAKWAVWRF